ncbi:MAG: succinate dehydrogenase cytochrome b subunit, partial [Betaproteobacteria bacterium]|nr:succinate dehydrogenase cytochrome b subunit [Betaproteobacteria bacterium]
MAAVLTLHQTTIGKKVIMAVTGIVLVAYVFVHMIGNLKLYQGPDALNNYADFLRVIAYPALAREQALWMVRAILLVSVVLHIWAAYSLTRLDWASRPVGYANKRLVQASYASRTMRWGGVIIGLFIIYHILHLTTGTIQPVAYTKDVYRNVVGGFQVWYVSLIYIVANVALAFHL